MSGAAEMVAAPSCSVSPASLSSIAWERIGQVWSFKEDVKEMDDKMVTMQVDCRSPLRLTYADRRFRGLGDALGQHWLIKKFTG